MNRLRREGTLARPASGRAGSRDQPRVVRLVHCAGPGWQDRFSRRHRHRQIAVPTAAALFRRHRLGADSARADWHYRRCNPRGVGVAGEVQSESGRSGRANYFKGLQNMQAFLFFYDSRALMPDFPTDSN